MKPFGGGGTGCLRSVRVAVRSIRYARKPIGPAKSVRNRQLRHAQCKWSEVL